MGHDSEDGLQLIGLEYERGMWTTDKDSRVSSKEMVMAIMGGGVDEIRCPRKDAQNEMRRSLKMKPRETVTFITEEMR